MSHADMNNCCGFNEAAAAFSWNSPKKAINPYLDPAEVAPVSTLSNLITLYAADNEQEQLRREALSDQVWERYFFNESRDPVQREMEQDKLISRAKLAHEQQRFNSDMVILADVNAQPSHISKPLMQRIEYFSSLGSPHGGAVGQQYTDCHYGFCEIGDCRNGGFCTCCTGYTERTGGGTGE